MSQSTKKELRYKFIYAEKCNMCGSPVSGHKVLGKRMNGSQGRSPQKKIGITISIVQCADCGLIYSNPEPIPFDIQDHYGKPPEEYWTESYFKEDEKYYYHEIKTIKGLMDFKEGAKVLEVGAGLGQGMIACQKAGFDVYGIESSIPFRERAISQMKVDPDRLKLEMLETAKFEENEFDVIIFSTVLEHLYDPSESIKTALKWLKPNGLIYIEVPSSDWLVAKIINFYYKLIGLDYVGNLSPMHDPFHLYEFSLKSFEKNAKIQNYEIASHKYLVFKTYMPKLLDFFIRPYMKWANKGMELIVVLKKK